MKKIIWSVSILILAGTLILLFGADRSIQTSLSGGCSAEASAFGIPKVPTADSRISYCVQGDTDKSHIETGVFPAGTQRLTLSMAGYPGNDGMTLEAVSENGQIREAINVPNIGDRWSTQHLRIPASLHESTFRLVLIDSATTIHGWAGISTPVLQTPASMLYRFIRLATLPLLASLWLLLSSICLPSSITKYTSRTIGALLALGAASYLCFHAYVIGPTLGKTTAIALLLAPFLGTFFLMVRAKHQARILKKELLRQSLALFLTLFILWIGLYPFTWDGTQWDVPMNRWRQMPPDNFIPLLFADMLKAGSIITPMLGDWLSSDRPPLQTGLFLMLAPIKAGANGTLAYQATSTWAQCLILIPISCLLLHPSLKKARTAITLCIAFSALVILNGLFVWPKLLAATYSLIYFIHLFHRDGKGYSWVICGLAAALAMLSHGGSIFALIGMTLFYMISKNFQTGKFFKTAATSLAIYFPWIIYQKLIDPPGDRLLKYHLAGVIPVTPKSLLETLKDSYGNLNLATWVESKTANLHLHLKGSVEFFSDVTDLLFRAETGKLEKIIENSFFFPSYSLWFASIIPSLAIVIFLNISGARQRRLPPYSLPIFATIILTALVYSLLMFSPGTTIIHQGSYLYPVLLMTAKIGRAHV